MKLRPVCVLGMGMLSIVFGALLSNGDVKPHPLFSDNMVLQQGTSVPIWGWADEGEFVHVTFQGQRAAVVAKEGRWMVHLKDLKPRRRPSTLLIEGNNSIEIKNVLVGEVWVGSGQSNMQWTVSNSNNAEEEIRAADYPTIRLFYVPRVVAGKPQDTVDAKWEVCSPETIAGFSAVLYYFGRTLHQELDLPMGLIHTSWGGTPAESWTTRETLESKPELKVIVDRWDRQIAEYDKAIDQYTQEVKAWFAQSKEQETKGVPISAEPRFPQDPRRHPHRASGLYNAMIQPLIPYAIQGAIWYQGESNASRAYQYRTLFTEMIKDWRKQWGIGEFSFFWVQLANFNAGEEQNWPELREAQDLALKLPNTGTAITIDIGDPVDIHPRNKQDVGKRLALNALAKTYGKDIVYSGPRFQSVSFEGGKAIIQFKHVGGGLTSKGNEPIQGFTIAGEDKVFHPAGARIEGRTVVVWSDQVPNPVAVRYGWKNNPEECNLYNEEGLPACPFRTDDWELITQGRE